MPVQRSSGGLRLRIISQCQRCESSFANAAQFLSCNETLFFMTVLPVINSVSAVIDGTKVSEFDGLVYGTV